MSREPKGPERKPPLLERKRYFESAPYPGHLKDGRRLTMMLDIVKHEAKKQPGISEADYEKRAEEIDGWLTSPERYQMGAGLRDVLNRIWADFAGARLKFGVMELLTASNVAVSREDVPLDRLFYMDYFTTNVLGIAGPSAPTSGTTGSMSVPDVRRYFKEHQAELKKQAEKSKEHFDTGAVPREDDRILVLVSADAEGRERMVVLDGNGRITRKITRSPDDAGQTVRAWVLRKTDDLPPRDFWIPTVRFADKLEEALRARSEEKREAVKNEIFDLFALSPGVGPIEFERAAPVNPGFAAEVLREWEEAHRKTR